MRLNVPLILAIWFWSTAVPAAPRTKCDFERPPMPEQFQPFRGVAREVNVVGPDGASKAVTIHAKRSQLALNQRMANKLARDQDPLAIEAEHLQEAVRADPNVAFPRGKPPLANRYTVSLEGNYVLVRENSLTTLTLVYHVEWPEEQRMFAQARAALSPEVLRQLVEQAGTRKEFASFAWEGTHWIIRLPGGAISMNTDSGITRRQPVRDVGGRTGKYAATQR